MNPLLFGTAGIPISTPKRDTEHGIEHVHTLGLDAMELEFVHSVNISKEKAPLLRQQAQKHGVRLTCHGQYYINLSATEKDKEKASIERVLHAARIAHAAGGWSVTFHAGFYLGRSSPEVSRQIQDNMAIIMKALHNEGVDIWVRPETTGKTTQWGDYREILQLSTQFDKVMPCFDFGHLHARTNGKFNTKEEWRTVFSDVETTLGKQGLSNMHIHMTGIAYGEKGEKHHLNLEESDLKWKELLATMKEFKIGGTVICESPNIEQDALLMKKTYQML